MEVTINELRTYKGTTLKIFIVLNNSPNGLSPKELAEMLGESRRKVYNGLKELRTKGIITENRTIVQLYQKSTQITKNRHKLPKTGKTKKVTKKKKKKRNKKL